MNGCLHVRQIHHAVGRSACSAALARHATCASPCSPRQQHPDWMGAGSSSRQITQAMSLADGPWDKGNLLCHGLFALFGSSRRENEKGRYIFVRRARRSFPRMCLRSEMTEPYDHSVYVKAEFSLSLVGTVVQCIGKCQTNPGQPRSWQVQKSALVTDCCSALRSRAGPRLESPQRF